MNLFENDKIILPLSDGIFEYYPSFFNIEKANELFRLLEKDITWQQDTITVFGKTHPQPRLTALYGNNGKSYQYSNIVMHPKSFSPLLTHIKEEIEAVCNQNFTTVLLNLYRDGNDSNGWHSDNEKELGRDPIIASLSLGEERIFHIKHNTKEEKFKINLENGSLLLMKHGSQIHYKHQLPKTKLSKNSRINLTFRTIL